MDLACMLIGGVCVVAAGQRPHSSRPSDHDLLGDPLNKQLQRREASRTVHRRRRLEEKEAAMAMGPSRNRHHYVTNHRALPAAHRQRKAMDYDASTFVSAKKLHRREDQDQSALLQSMRDGQRALNSMGVYV